MSRLSLLAMFALPFALAAQQPVGWPGAVERFDRFVREDSIVGGGLVLVRDGTIALEEYRGLRMRPDAPATRATIWHWGSITKTLTAVATLQLGQHHLFGDPMHGPVNGVLDEPLVTLVPEAQRIHNPYGSMASVTIRMLLAHTSGLQASTWPWDRGEPWEPFEPTEWSQLVAMMPYMRLAFPPGSQYSYSNPGFVYVARFLEAMTGDPWQGLVFKGLLVPLGMAASYFGRTPWHLLDRRSGNHSVQPGGVRTIGFDFDPGITIPNGGWNAPITDIARWLGFLMGSDDPDLQAGYDRLLPHTEIASMWQPVVRVSDEEEMGLSFFLRTVNGRRLVGHTGTQANFRSFFWMDPASRTAVIGVVNTSNEVDPTGSARGWQEVMAAARDVLARNQ